MILDARKSPKKFTKQFLSCLKIDSNTPLKKSTPSTESCLEATLPAWDLKPELIVLKYGKKSSSKDLLKTLTSVKSQNLLFELSIQFYDFYLNLLSWLL